MSEMLLGMTIVLCVSGAVSLLIVIGAEVYFRWESKVWDQGFKAAARAIDRALTDLDDVAADCAASWDERERRRQLMRMLKEGMSVDDYV